MKAFSPAGMATKGLFGYARDRTTFAAGPGAKSFGNPDGATSGGGAYRNGGASPDGPGQGGNVPNGGGGGGTLLNWTARNGGLSGLMLGVAYGLLPGHVVAVNAQTASTVSANSGSTWTAFPGSSPGGDSFQSVAYGNGVFCAALNSGIIARSTDGGQTWAAITPALPSNGTATAYLGGVWLTLGSLPGPNNYAVSADNALTWTQPALFTNSGWVSIGGLTTDGTHFVACGNQTVTNSPTINTSLDGQNWVETVLTGVVTAPPAPAFGNGVYVLGSSDAATVRRAATAAGLAAAPDVVVPFVTGDTQITAVGFGANLFAVFGNNGGVVTSPDGVTWTNENLNSGGNQAFAVAEQSGIFVAVGLGGIVSTRP